MKTKFYWVALLASAAFIGQAQGGPHGGRGEMGGGRSCQRRWPVVGGGVALVQLGRSGFPGSGFQTAAPALSGTRGSFGVGAHRGGVGFGIPRYSSFGARPLYRRLVFTGTQEAAH